MEKRPRSDGFGFAGWESLGVEIRKLDVSHATRIVISRNAGWEGSVGESMPCPVRELGRDVLIMVNASRPELGTSHTNGVRQE